VVVCDDTGVADFEMLHNRGHEQRAILYAFDLLDLDGQDQRALSLENRKARLDGLLRGVPAGIQYCDHLDSDGAEVFEHACKLGCEGIVSKDRTRPYRSGPSKTWLKIEILTRRGLGSTSRNDAHWGGCGGCARVAFSCGSQIFLVAGNSDALA
jgi:bifunctional non-homologous end joining protein LigD